MSTGEVLSWVGEGFAACRVSSTAVERAPNEAVVGEGGVVRLEQPDTSNTSNKAERTKPVRLIIDILSAGFRSLSRIVLETVNCAEFLGEVAHIGCRVDLATGHALHELLGLELGTMLVDVLT